MTENRKGHLLTLLRLKPLALSTLILGAAGAATAPLWAQQTEREPRGIQLRFGTSFGLETQSNRSLDVSDPGRTSAAVIDLSFGVLTETRNQRFSFDLGGTLREINGDTSDESGFVNPFIGVTYDRSSASARLSLSARIRESDLSNSGFDFDPDIGQLVFIEGSAVRRNTNLSARLDWRDDAPLGFGVFARVEENTFRGGVATGIGGDTLNDTRRLTLGGSIRFDINEAVQLDTRLTYSTFEEETVGDDRDTITLGNDLTISQPRGDTTFGFDVTDTEEGTRVGLTAGRAIAYPLGVVSGRLGVTRGVNGDAFLNGGLSLTRALPRGNFSLDLARNVTSGTLEDTQQINTRLSARYLYELNPLSNVSVDVNWAEAQQTATDIDTINASIGATYTRALTPDWNMDFSIRHRMSDDDATGTARSNEFSINLRREFLTSF